MSCASSRSGNRPGRSDEVAEFIEFDPQIAVLIALSGHQTSSTARTGPAMHQVPRATVHRLCPQRTISPTGRVDASTGKCHALRRLAHLDKKAVKADRPIVDRLHQDQGADNRRKGAEGT